MTVPGWLNIPKQVRQTLESAFLPIHHTLAGYSPANSPHLTPALELDSALVEFSANLPSRGLPSTIESEADLSRIINALEQVLKDLNLWQYYVLGPSQERTSVFTALGSGNVTPWTGAEVTGKSVVELAEILRSENKIVGLGSFASRFGVHVQGDVAAAFVKAAFVDAQDVESLADAWIKIVDVVNVDLYKEWEDDTRVALDNIRNRVRYTRLDAHGPKLREISTK
jgi:glycogen debranching enzyme